MKLKLFNMENKQATEHLQNEDIFAYFNRVRHDTELLCEPLEIEDYGIQTMPEVSPPKWHLAHTSWFFETMLLKPFMKSYKEYNPQFSVLFNSYYDTIGTYHPRDQRGLLSRPTVKEVFQYRHFIDKAMDELLKQTSHPQYKEILSRTVLGLNHEQQHQELLLTDIKHIFASNPLKPTYQRTIYKKTPQSNSNHIQKATPINWIEVKGGIKSIGCGQDSDFSYDNESPQHKVFLEDFSLASQPVNNRDYIEFINAGGYQQVDLWLSDAWQTIKQQHWLAPLYWELTDGKWQYMTLSGLQEIDLDAAVCHVSFYEAAAYARWKSLEFKGVRLPTEAEWELAATPLNISGNFRESGLLQPQALSDNTSLQHMFGDVWEWTQSAYSSYPGYHAEDGPLGEYNGKFMSSQMVLRGGSCITPIDHIRATYRNFFYPHERWQFSGFRLARDI